MTTAVGYVRVSRADQAREGFSLDDQRRALRAEADRRGWGDIRILSDAGRSGRSLDRPGLQEALSLLASGEAKILAVSKLDRLSRSLSDFAGLLERAGDGGWAIVALDLGVDMTTPAGELVANVLASVARWERRVIADRLAEGRREKAAQGIGWAGGRVPYGYRTEDRGRILTLGPREEVLAVKFIFRRASRGRSSARIAADLEVGRAEGVSPSPSGKPWTAQAVRRIRRNPIYAGSYEVDGVRVPAPAIVKRWLWDDAQRNEPLKRQARRRELPKSTPMTDPTELPPDTLREALHWWRADQQAAGVEAQLPPEVLAERRRALR
jgi:DNA invertase Pin-like site-specific DNA recombinase